MPFVIAWKDEECEVFWTCRAGTTDNFSYDVKDAALFSRKDFAGVTRKALNMEDCYVKEV